MLITSTQNDGIKRLRGLKQRSLRERSGLHLIEGERLVLDAAGSGAQIVRAYIEEGREDIGERLLAMGLAFDTVTASVMRSVADTDTPQGVCAAVKTPDTTTPESYPHGLIIALDTLQDPGNLGTVLRTADAFGAAGLLVGAGCTDPYSPKALRAAMGSTYHLPVWQGELATELLRLKVSGYSLVCGHLAGEESLPELSPDRVLVIGNEGSGLTDAAASLADRYIRIPMEGSVESLNAAMAAGMAKQGLVPVFCVYSSFLQRSFDMLIHDVSLLRLHAVFCVDRAGLVGSDGETHQGVFDISYLRTVPGMKILCPASFGELEQMLRRAVSETDGPVAVRSRS